MKPLGVDGSVWSPAFETEADHSPSPRVGSEIKRFNIQQRASDHYKTKESDPGTQKMCGLW